MRTSWERRHESAKGRAITDALVCLPLPDTPEIRESLGGLYERGYNAASSAKSQRKRRAAEQPKELEHGTIG